MMKKFIDIISIIAIWLIVGWIISRFHQFNWDFFIGGMVGYILAILFYHKKITKKITKIEVDTHVESEVDDAPWYR